MNLPPRISMGDLARSGRVFALRRDLRIIKICAIGLLAIAALTGGVAAGAVLAPTAIAVILALVLAPVAQALERMGFIPALAALVTVLALSSILVVGSAAVAPSFSHWIHRAPQLVHSVELKLRPFRKQLAAVESASDKISTVVSKPAPPPPRPSIVAMIFDNAPGVVASVLYVAVLTIFLLSERRRYAAQLILLPRTFCNRLRMARICRDVRQRVSGYLFTLASINVGLAIATAICFTVAGIPDPLLWGVAYGILNFLPIIGPTAIIVTAAAVGFVTADTFSGALLPPAILLGLDVIEAYFVQPWLLSRRLVISPIAIFVMVATLVWMWGAAGVITAVPMLILIHTVMLHVPSLRAYARFLATEHWRPRSPVAPRNSLKARPFS